MKANRWLIASLLLVSLCGLVVLFSVTGCYEPRVTGPPEVTLDEKECDEANANVPDGHHKVKPGRYKRHPSAQEILGVRYIDANVAKACDLVDEHGNGVPGAYVGTLDGLAGFLPAEYIGPAPANPRSNGRNLGPTQRSSGSGRKPCPRGACKH